jgi:hypothetical protein
VELKDFKLVSHGLTGIGRFLFLILLKLKREHFYDLRLNGFFLQVCYPMLESKLFCVSLEL